MVHFLLRYNLIIRPGFETRSPEERIKMYCGILEQAGRSVVGQKILNFGYGGNFALACGLLQAGASQITLVDKFAPPDNHFNRKLLPVYEKYLTVQDGLVTPRPEYIDLVEADIHEMAEQSQPPLFDIVLSSSVYEHLNSVDQITRSLAVLTKPTGCQVHFIDLRDHYFKFPFEMLTFSDETWEKWLNPGSNLNRLRTKDYRSIFEGYFRQVDIGVLERDLAGFQRVQNRILPKYLTGDTQIDAITLLQVYAEQPYL
jgi:hypothetical protein